MPNPKSQAELGALFKRWREAKRPLGALKPQEFARGMHACYSNAKGLLEDSRLLAEHDRLPRAFALTVLAFEELGKVPLLCDPDPADPSKDPAYWKGFWKEFRQHRIKQEVMLAYGRRLDKIPWLKLNNPDFVWFLSSLKELSFYVDCRGEEFQMPEFFVGQVPAMLELLFAAVEERVDSFAELHETEEMSADFLARVGERKSGKEQVEPAFRSHTPAQSGTELRARLRSSVSHCVQYGSEHNVTVNPQKCDVLAQHYVTIHDHPLLHAAISQEIENLSGRLIRAPALHLSALRAAAMISLLKRFLEPLKTAP